MYSRFSPVCDPSSLPDSGEVRLAWALVDGDLRHVSEFREVPPRKRPPAVCPACEEPITLVLGARRAPHCRHRPESRCPATNPETAEHLNAKFHLYWQLYRATLSADGPLELIISEPCAGPPPEWSAWTHGRKCEKRVERLWVPAWDAVEVEPSLRGTRPDVLLLFEGQPVGALELHATHEVTPEKAEVLRALGVPWVEIQANKAFYASPNGWQHPNPLPIDRHGEEEPWRCATHERKATPVSTHPAVPDHRIHREVSDISALPWTEMATDYASKNYEHPWLARMVYLYYPGGYIERLFYLITADVREARVRHTHLECYIGEERQIVATVPGGTPEEDVLEQLFSAYEAHLELYKGDEGKDDSPMDWFRSPKGWHWYNTKAHLERHCLGRLRWDGASTWGGLLNSQVHWQIPSGR